MWWTTTKCRHPYLKDGVHQVWQGMCKGSTSLALGDGRRRQEEDGRQGGANRIRGRRGPVGRPPMVNRPRCNKNVIGRVTT